MPAPAAEIDVTPDLVRGPAPGAAPGPGRSARSDGWLAAGTTTSTGSGDDLSVRLPRRLGGAFLILARAAVAPRDRRGPAAAGAGARPHRCPRRRATRGHGRCCPWLPGTVIEAAHPDDWEAAARQLGEFLAAVHRPVAARCPANPYRGVPLAGPGGHLRGGSRPPRRRRRPGAADGRVAPSRGGADRGTGPPVWLHGDIHPLNVLVDRRADLGRHRLRRHDRRRSRPATWPWPGCCSRRPRARRSGRRVRRPAAGGRRPLDPGPGLGPRPRRGHVQRRRPGRRHRPPHDRRGPRRPLTRPPPRFGAWLALHGPVLPRTSPSTGLGAPEVPPGLPVPRTSGACPARPGRMPGRRRGVRYP